MCQLLARVCTSILSQHGPQGVSRCSQTDVIWLIRVENGALSSVQYNEQKSKCLLCAIFIYTSTHFKRPSCKIAVQKAQSIRGLSPFVSSKPFLELLIQNNAPLNIMSLIYNLR